MTETLEFKAYWYLPSNPDNAIAGILTYSSNKSIKLNIGSLSDIAKINNGILKSTYTDEKEQLIYL